MGPSPPRLFVVSVSHVVLHVSRTQAHFFGVVLVLVLVLVLVEVLVVVLVDVLVEVEVLVEVLVEVRKVL